ncbi:hypothetical protein [Hymenobacter sp. YC55]|uniref:hypothetical protein n=1 Tax=Hymenobacter sp. YC55 TaxID=3034019 RepID=UPI0023F8A7E2|nr:hypothetical protein [Hymenobacter sp. YC55]MDF7815153.1 hypothetical protein [Hymenobacter sp. YC55]
MSILSKCVYEFGPFLGRTRHPCCQSTVFDLGQQLGGYGNLNAVAGEEVAQQGPGVEAQPVAFGGVQGLIASSPCRAGNERY